MDSPKLDYFPSQEPFPSSTVRRQNVAIPGGGSRSNCTIASESSASDDRRRDFSRHLIAAQEEERRKIARELHDDLSQRVALLMIRIDQLKAAVSEKQHQRQLNSLSQAADEIATTIHQLSRQLHPSKLERLGLVAALSSHCRELSSPHNLQVQFEPRDIPNNIPIEISVCLYRVLQEALRNVVRHSGARKAQVQLQGCFGGIELIVSDTGSGFEMTPERLTGGLGLTSMYERVSLLQGELTIESSQLRGTRIGAWVPLPKAGINGPKELK